MTKKSLSFPIFVTAFVAAASPAFAQETLSIGFTASKTGALSEVSLAQVRGFELWRDEVNAAGGIRAGGKKYKVELKSYDDESQTVRVQELYARLITQDKAQFLFGPVSSGLSAIAAFVSEENGRLLLSTAADPKIFRLGNRNLFQVTTPVTRSFDGAVTALKVRIPNARVALVSKDDPFTRVIAQATRDLVKSEGLTLVLDEAYAASLADFAPLAGKVASANADALFGGGHIADGLALARALHVQKTGLKWLTLLAAPDAPHFAELGNVALGVSWPSQWAPRVSYKPDFGPSAQVFTRRFSDKFKSAPTDLAAAGYASGLVLANAIEKAGTVEPGKVGAALNQIDATTLFGRVKFATDSKEHGLQIAHEMILRQWQRKAGRLVPEVISPVSIKTADALGL